MTTEQITATAGTVVNARPWSKGTELEAVRGVVLAETFGNDGEYALVWFPGRGDPKLGDSVQPILHVKIQKPRALTDVAATTVARWYSAVKRVNRAGMWRTEWNEGGFAIERALRTIKGQ